MEAGTPDLVKLEDLEASRQLTGRKHILSLIVENKPGVLARIAGLFSRRGFNIESLAVGPTEHAEVSRMTIVVNVEDSPLEQVTKQLNKLVEVIKIVELDTEQSVHRELVLVKVSATAETRGQILDVVRFLDECAAHGSSNVCGLRGFL